LPPVRTAGGVLVGIIEEVFEVVSWSIRAFYVSVVVINKRDKFTWNLVSLYGSAYNEHKQEFLDELDLIYSINNIHIMVGGDFNLIEMFLKNNNNINQNWVDKFNNWVNQFGLMELKPSNRMYTWANNQQKIVMVAIDKDFVSTCWDSHFPTAHVQALARIESDHTPLVFDFGLGTYLGKRPFRFEKWWL
jgi:exonuclease III